MPRRPLTKLSIASLGLLVIAAFYWINSFSLEYFPPGLLGFKWHPTHATPQWQCVCLVLTGVSTISGGIAFRSRYLLDYRTRHGFCPRCGYDLRATAEQCPECGAVPGETEIRED